MGLIMLEPPFATETLDLERQLAFYEHRPRIPKESRRAGRC